MNNEHSAFRVVVVGPSASGKSTAARRLLKSHPGSFFWIEASRDLIDAREYRRSDPFELRTEHGRRFFRQASERRGPNWIAKRLLRATEDKSSLNILATGLRGVDNLTTLKRAGFFVLFFATPRDVCVRRLVEREGITAEQAAHYLSQEEELYRFKSMREKCDFVLNTDQLTEWEVERCLFNICLTVTRKTSTPPLTDTCVTCAMPRALMLAERRAGNVCRSCSNYSRVVRPDDTAVLREMLEDIGPGGNEKALLGFSGGKDSTAALYFLQDAGANFETFTIDMGYYPLPMLHRARTMSHAIGLTHHRVDGRQQITADLHESYELTADLFDNAEVTEVAQFLDAYLKSRRHYSAKDCTPMAHPRVCVLCRKSVIRTYYAAATTLGAKYIILGINEWATLSASENGSVTAYSGARKLAPSGDEGPVVFVVHLPYILGATLSRNRMKLDELGWSVPFGESFVETNSNSCLLAKASEMPFFRRLGFHPDASRLSREVMVGFLDRAEAVDALAHLTRSPWSVRHTLEYAEILKCAAR